MAEYYDVVLGAIPLSLVGVSGALSIAGLSLTTAIPLAAVVSVGLIGHAMFVNGPVDATVDPPGGSATSGEFDSEDVEPNDVETGAPETTVPENAGPEAGVPETTVQTGAVAAS